MAEEEEIITPREPQTGSIDVCCLCKKIIHENEDRATHLEQYPVLCLPCWAYPYDIEDLKNEAR